MLSSFPEGYRATPDIHERYPKLYNEMLKTIQLKAGKVAGSAMSAMREDAMQEGRIALFNALVRYDKTKGASLKWYAGRVLDNTYNLMLYQQMAACRMPRTVKHMAIYRFHCLDCDHEFETARSARAKCPECGAKGGRYDSKGNQISGLRHLGGYSDWRVGPSPAASLDELMAGENGAKYEPQVGFQDPGELFADVLSEARCFKMIMINTLGKFEREVFQCKTNPPCELLELLDNIGTDEEKAALTKYHEAMDKTGDTPDFEIPNRVIIEHIAKTHDMPLKKAKNKVDWALHKIRAAFTTLAKGSRFSEFFGEHIEKRGWPIIHIAEGEDPDFKARVIKARSLDPHPTKGYASDPRHVETAEGCARKVVKYPWGVAMYLRHGQEARTLVIEGERVNIDTGEVFGPDGSNERIPVKWYPRLAKTLKENRAWTTPRR